MAQAVFHTRHSPPLGGQYNEYYAATLQKQTTLLSARSFSAGAAVDGGGRACAKHTDHTNR